MNKITQNLFQWIYPFYPLWAWIFLAFVHVPVDKILLVVMLPSVFYIIWNIKTQIPVYLWFFLCFTIYHVSTVYYFDLLPEGSSWPMFILSDPNVIALVLFFIIEHTDFDEGFITKMNRHILWIVVLSLLVSIIQIKSPFFFFNNGMDDEGVFATERNTSIYSWVNLNSGGVSFPIMIAILLNVYDTNSKPFSLITVSGIVVTFLTKARYVMISTIIAFLQLLIVKSIPLKKKLMVIGFFVVGIFLIVGVAQMAGYDIDKTINERILEKDNDMGSAKTRILSFEVFKMKFPENPYFGVGPKTRADVVDLLGGEAPIIHVGYLSYLYFYGFFGAMLLFLALIFLLRDAWIIGRREDFWGSFYGFIGFALANFTFVYFNFSEMGIILAVIYLRYYKVNPERL